MWIVGRTSLSVPVAPRCASGYGAKLFRLGCFLVRVCGWLRRVVFRHPRFRTSTRFPMSPTAASLIQAIRDRSAQVGVIGLGYVGLPLMRAFVNAGFRVIG